jgi:hypothetical protein
LGKCGSGKNIILTDVNDCLYILKGQKDVFFPLAQITLDSFEDILGIGKVKIYALNTVYTFVYSGLVQKVKKRIENIDIVHNMDFENNYIEVYGFYSSILRNGHLIKNCSYNFIGSSNWTSIGFFNYTSPEKCYVENSKVGFADCILLQKNKVLNAIQKYSNCYASESANTTYLIPTGGGDFPNAGFNT